jgi:hypothetical protein
MPAPRKHTSPAQRQRAYRARQSAARLSEVRAKGLPQAAPIPTMPSAARWRAMIQMANNLLEAARQEMETYRDDRSEAWQESEKGEEFQETIDSLDGAIDCLAEIP